MDKSVVREIAELTEFIRAHEKQWMSVKTVSWQGSTVRLVFETRSRRGGPVLGHQCVTGKGVRESLICDVNGGGLALYDQDHPLVRQYADPRASLYVQGMSGSPSGLAGALALSHEKAVDDWIPVARYLGSLRSLADGLARRRRQLCVGPLFLVEQYASALEACGINVELRKTPDMGKRAPELFAIHFGNSYVVAERISLDKQMEGLSATPKSSHTGQGAGRPQASRARARPRIGRK